MKDWRAGLEKGEPGSPRLPPQPILRLARSLAKRSPPWDPRTRVRAANYVQGVIARGSAKDSYETQAPPGVEEARLRPGVHSRLGLPLTR